MFVLIDSDVRSDEDPRQTFERRCQVLEIWTLKRSGIIKPVWNSLLRATARVVKQGQTVGLVECDVTDDKDKLVARATSTCMTLRGGQAHGR
jgi:hypothetical protein